MNKEPIATNVKYPPTIVDPECRAINSILAERHRQERKWGQRNHGIPVWILVLMEEVGELSKEELNIRMGAKRFAELRAEAVQVAAVSMAMIEYIDREHAQRSGPQPLGGGEHEEITREIGQ